ncbi:hypothetical protein LP420_40240 [Massilia sp. B-10]|nr:hypothetical protein LP420_40240 [Massilia sp. B-10]
MAPGVDVSVVAMDTSAAIGAWRCRHRQGRCPGRRRRGGRIPHGRHGPGGRARSALAAASASCRSIIRRSPRTRAPSMPMGDAVITASDDTEIMMISGGVGGGFVGVGASVGVTVVHKNTQAFVADGAAVNAKGAGVGSTAGCDFRHAR